MGWGGKAVGIGIGSLLGGPIGAVIGGGIGALFDASSTGEGTAHAPPSPKHLQEFEVDVDQLGVETVVTPSGPGAKFTVEIKSSRRIPGELVTGVFFLDGEKEIRANHPDFRNNEGDLLTLGPVVLSSNGREGVGIASIPYAAFGSWPRVLTVEVLVFADDEVVGKGQFSVDWEPRTVLEDKSFLAALVCATVGVVRSDDDLESSEAKFLREHLTAAFELDEHGQTSLKRLLKAENGRPASPAKAAQRMAPHIDDRIAPAVVELLYETAASDGGVSKAEDAWISEFCDALNIPLSVRAEARRAQCEDFAQHYAVLELEEGASLADIKRAYRRLAADYHPDKVATLPKGFQDFANQRMRDLNAAYDILRKAAAASDRDA